MSSRSEIEFKQASSTDVSELVELRIKQLIDEGYPEVRDIRRELTDYFSTNINNGTLICWIGMANDTVVATAGLCFYQLPSTFTNPTGKIAYITNMYTRDDYRRRGIASHLLNQLLIDAKRLNYNSVKLHASRHGKSVYEKAGFTDSDGYMDLKL